MNQPDPNVRLHSAITERNLALLRHALEDGADPQAISRDRHESPLKYAITRRFEAGALALIDHGAKVTASPGRADSPLVAAATMGELNMCRALLARGAPVDERDRDGNTALFGATSQYQIEVCRLLLEHGADVNAANNDGITPLQKAVILIERLSVDLLRLLIRAGASTAAPSREQSFPSAPLTTFQSAVANGIVHIAAFFLDECDEDPSQLTLSGRTMFELCNPGPMRDLLQSAVVARSVRAAVGEKPAQVDPEVASERARTRHSSPALGSL
jgi:ankyrin repeat protein